MQKTTVIHHSADFDGIFCREIARKFLGNEGVEYIGWDYGDPVPELPGPEVETIYMLDISLPAVWMVDERLIWIDHHKSAMMEWDPGAPAKSPKGYRIDGVAACRLAWQWFFSIGGPCQPPGTLTEYHLPDKERFINRSVDEPLAVRLAGEYDIWDKRDPRAETFQFGLRSIEEPDWELLLDTGESCKAYAEQLLVNGCFLQRYQREVDAGVVKRGFEVEFEGKKFLALNTARCNSLTFESAAQPNHDGLMGFYFNGQEWVVSLYHSPHHKEHDLSAIAVKFGGGHRGACGFRTKLLPFIHGT